MRISFVVLLGLALALSANAAFASPASDPSIVIHKTGDPSLITIITDNSPTDPLIVPLIDGISPPLAFEYVGPNATSTLDELFVELENPIVGEVFSCDSDIFTGPCFPYATGVDDTVGVLFTGGTMTSGEFFSVAVPESNSWIMLLCSALGLMALGLYYRQPKHAL